MRTLGLTGGVGTGKSALVEWLRRERVPVVDTDEVAHSLVEPGQPAWEEIRQAFGGAYFDPEGRLIRSALAGRVFADREALRALEGILHPRIHAVWRERIEGWRDQGQGLAVVVIPLLFEKGLENEFDLTICVACRPGTQRVRLRARGWSEEEIEGRIEAQLPLAEKMRRADRVIWNEGGLALLSGQARTILRQEGGMTET